MRIELAGGTVVTSSITNEAVDDLALKAGDRAYAVIKSSDVMIGKRYPPMTAVDTKPIERSKPKRSIGSM